MHTPIRNPMDHIFVSPFLTTFQRVQKRLQKAHRYFRLCFILLCSCWCWSSLECRQLRKEWWLPCRWSRSRWSSSSTAGTLPLSRSLASFDLSTLVSLLLCWKNNVLVNMFLNHINHCNGIFTFFWPTQDDDDTSIQHTSYILRKGIREAPLPKTTVGGMGWTDTFINHCFYGIFDPFFVKNFR